jgi:hypothetical protein
MADPGEADHVSVNIAQSKSFRNDRLHYVFRIGRSKQEPEL